MKRLAIALLVIIVTYIVYRDVSVGTIPVSVSTTTNYEKDVHYKTITVQTGDTLLSIVEREVGGSLPVSIEQLIADFHSLNPNTSAHTLQIGKTYRIPLYNNR